MNNWEESNGRHDASKEAAREERQLLRELYYLTEALKNLLAIMCRLAIIGAILLAIAIGVARTLYLLS